MPSRSKSCIPAYQNYVPCGNPKCKDSCTSSYLNCVICHKSFHYKCAGLTKKTYLEFVNKRKNFICEDTCFKLLFPFHGISQIDFLITQFDSNDRPCKKCKKECLGMKHMKCSQCEACKSWFHDECANINPTYYYDGETKRKKLKKILFFCSIKCEMSTLPFYKITKEEFIYECDPFSDTFPCSICSLDCPVNCLQCSNCEKWVHFQCTDLGHKLNDYINNDREYYCNNKRCEMRLLPFHSSPYPLCNDPHVDSLSVEICKNSTKDSDIFFTSRERILRL